jgi:DNA-binding MurR/RpiR family transcriptional regulator
LLNDVPSLQDRIGSRFETLSPRLKVAARYVAEHPHEVAMRSLRQIAITIELAPPTFTRLARAVGCESYEELREICRSETSRKTLTFAERARSLQESARGPEMIGRRQPGAFLREQGTAAITNIEALLRNIDLKALGMAADVLASADRVLLVGALSSTAIVEYMAYMAAMAFPNWAVVGRGGSSVPGGLLDVSKRDAVLAVAKSPYARRSVEGVRLARQGGAHIVAVTDGVQSPVMRLADHSFVVATEGPNFFPSHAATILLLETLMGMVVRRSGKQAQRRIEAIENANRDSGEYWQI